MSDPSILEAAARALLNAYYPMSQSTAELIAGIILPAVTPLIRAAALEEAAQVAHKEAATYDALIEQGKGEYGKPSYVRDDTWNSWLGKYSVAMSIASDVRTLKDQP